MKHLKIIICILIILNLFGCTNYEYNGKENIINENKIVIDKIHINHKYTISNIDKKVNGIVMFKEYGRPNIDDSNTIIGAHSGYGKNVYFNDLNRLEVALNIVSTCEENEISKYITSINIENINNNT